MRPIGDWSMSMTLSRCSRPSILSCGAGVFACAVQAARGGFVERLDDQGGLAAARDAGDAGEGAERDLGRDVLQIVAAGAGDLERFAVAGAALRRHFDLAQADEVLAGEARRVAHHLVGRAFGDDFAAVDAGAGAHVDDVVGGADGVFVVLDDDDRVAEIAQAAQRFEQALVVALMQADRRFVEHVEHARQARTDLRGEADALALAARQGARVARQRQIFEADVVEKAQAVADLFQDARRRSRVAWR